jgi:hypothetical protein
MSDDSVERFAEEARLFERWLLDGSEHDADAAREALRRLLKLYSCALDLPEPWSDELEAAPEVSRLDEGEFRRAYDASKRLPLDLYSEVFDPTIVPADEAVVASLADDLGDIYRDVGTGLRAYESGNRAGAVWEWSFNLRSHWGAHATGAIRALHWWLKESALDRLSVPPGEAG